MRFFSTHENTQFGTIYTNLLKIALKGIAANTDGPLPSILSHANRIIGVWKQSHMFSKKDA